MGAKRAAFGPRKSAVELPRDRLLGLVARHGPLELLAKGLPGPEDQRLDRALAELQHGGDLAVGAPLELAHGERRALRERERRKGALDVLRAEAVDLVLRGRVHPRVESDLTRTPRRRPEALAADVVRDRDQPV